MATPDEVRQKLVDVLGEEVVAGQEATNELRKFSAATKSMAARQKQFGENLINSGIPLIKFAGTMMKTLSSYNANIKIANQQQQTNQQKLNALEAKRLKNIQQLDAATKAVADIRTKAAEQEKAAAKKQSELAAAKKDKELEAAKKESQIAAAVRERELAAANRQRELAARKLQATSNSIEATKLDTEQQTETVRSLKSAKIGEVMQQTAKSMKETGQAFTRLTTSLNKTQTDFGVGIGGAATLRVNAMIDTAKDAAEILSNIDLGAAASAAMDIGTGLGKATIALGENKGIDQAAAALSEGLRKAQAPVEGPPLDQLLLPSERLEGMRELQSQFGVMNATLGKSLAQTAKNYGVSVQQLVQARRAFVTITNGDLSKVDALQNKFFATFKQAGMERRIALEAITKYADIIARNGTRFADSFARAAADAKRIGVDLSKVEQFGDSIIGDFEGFLEKQAELGAMGFGFDSSRLLEVAATGDTGALYRELSSQLAMMGKDINNLTRPERLVFEGMGIDIATMQRMAGGKPEIASEDIPKDNNTKLTHLLTLLQTTGPFLGFLGDIARGVASMASAIGEGLSDAGSIAKKLGLFSFLRGGGLLVTLTALSIAGLTMAIGDWITGLIGKASSESDELAKQAAEQYKKGNISEGDKLRDLSLKKEMQASITTPGDGFGTGLIRSDIRNQRIKLMEDERNAALVRQGKKPRSESKPASLFPWLEGVDEKIGGKYPSTKPETPKIEPPKTQQEYNEMFINDIRQKLDSLKMNKKASGGVISGPGTGTSDSIPTMLSNGEYVLPAALVSRIGVKNLDRLRTTAGSSKTMSIDPGEDLIEAFTYMFNPLLEAIGTSDKTRVNANNTHESLYKTLRVMANTYTPIQYKRIQIMDREMQSGKKIERKKDGGLVGRLTRGYTSNMQRGTDFAEWLSSKYQNVSDKNRSFTNTGNSAISTLMNFGSSGKKGSGIANWVGNKLQSVMDTKDSMVKSGMGFLSSLPGASRVSGVVSGMINNYKEGGMSGVIKGGMKSLAATGVGKAVGGALGSFIPIPGVGTAIGSFLGSKVGKFASGLFGRRKQPAAQQIMGALPDVAGFAGNLMGRIPGMERFNPEAMFRNAASSQQAQAAVQTVVDTTGIEQKLNNFITALNGMNIVMDGAKVGKVLVNVSDAATTLGVFKPTSRATL